MARARAQYLPTLENMNLKTFGGSLVKGNPREARPISIKRPMHLVMRSTLARGPYSFLHVSRCKRIENLIRYHGKLNDIRVYRYANSGNHLHIVILPRSRRAFKTFVRSISGLIARITTNVERGC